MTVSLWRRSARMGVISCDTAVLGGGISGVAAALALEERGIDALIIDRGSLGSGASTRNAGFLMRGAADNYAVAIRDWGRDTARRVWRLTEQNLALLRERGVRQLPTYRDQPSTLLALDPVEAAELRDSARLMRDDGFDVELIEQGRDAAWRSGKVIVGLVNPHDACANPADLLAHLSRSLRRPPLLHQEVAQIDVLGPARVELITPDAVVRARRLLVATNAFTPLLFPRLADLIAPKRGQILAFNTAGRQFDHSYYANRGGEYFRQTSDTTAIIGGWRRFFADTEVGYDDRTTTDVQQGLESFITRFVPARLNIIARWSGVMGFTPDGLPLVGPVNTDGSPAAHHSPIWLSAGCTGHGMSMFFATAQHAVRAMLAEEPSHFPITRPLSPTAHA